jgi:hypothetical protein
MDIKYGSISDVSRRSTQELVLSWIRSGRLWYIHFGTPCAIRPLARGGITDLCKARAKEHLGIELPLFIAEASRECSRCGVSWSLENPKTSCLFSFPPIAS